MATSSIIENIRVNNPQVLEDYVSFMEAAGRQPVRPRTETERSCAVTSSEQIKSFVEKAKGAGIWKAQIKITDDFDEPPEDSASWYRKPGMMKGQIIMSDDFDEPLDDFAEYM